MIHRHSIEASEATRGRLPYHRILTLRALFGYKLLFAFSLMAVLVSPHAGMMTGGELAAQTSAADPQTVARARAAQDRKAFSAFVDALTVRDTEKVKIQYVLLTIGPTVTTAFGHTAIRIVRGKTGGDEDYFVDFGRYYESSLFLWRFLRGHAQFDTHLEKTRTVMPEIEGLGRGVIVHDIKFTPEQKLRFLRLANKILKETAKGYEYNNFTRNCVTFVRDMVNETTGKKLKLKIDSLDAPDWRTRVLPFSNNIFWLRINEKLLFDHDTDKLRGLEDLIFLPYDLRLAMTQADLLGPAQLMLPDRWRINAHRGADWTGYGGYLLMLLAILFLLPVARFEKRRRISLIIFAVFSGFGGLIAFTVWLITAFDFMNETLMWLVFFPTDFILLGGAFKRAVAGQGTDAGASDGSSKFPLYYGIGRLAMILIALILVLTVYGQSIYVPLLFALLFYSLLLFHIWRNKNVPA